MRVTPQHDEVVGIGIDPSPEQSYPRHQQDPADVVVDDEATAGGGEDDGPASYWKGAAFHSGAGTGSMGRLRCTAAASSRTTAAKRCSITSIRMPPRRRHTLWR